MRFIRDDTARYDFVSIFGFIAWLVSAALVFVAIIAVVLLLTVGTSRAQSGKTFYTEDVDGWTLACVRGDDGGMDHCGISNIFGPADASRKRQMRAEAVMMGFKSQVPDFSHFIIYVGASAWNIPKADYKVNMRFYDNRSRVHTSYTATCEQYTDISISCMSSEKTAADFTSDFMRSKGIGFTINGKDIGAYDLKGSMKAMSRLAQIIAQMGGSSGTFGTTGTFGSLEGTF